MDRPELRGAAGSLASRFAADEIATACVAVSLMAASALQSARHGPALEPRLDREHVAFAVRSERYFRHGSQRPMGFAPLSRFWRASDGWVRTHANYAWHRDALLGELRVPNDAARVAAAIAERPAHEVERAVYAAGGIAAAVRTLEEWRAHPQGTAVADEPLIAHRSIGGAAARPRVASDLPVRDVRVLDMTRVIAGPVCTRYLGALGADVLRVDPPGHLDMAPGAIADTLFAKRSSLLDATLGEDRAQLHELLSAADVVVRGYRPGALDRWGLGEDELADRYPGLVIVSVSAWGHGGPWADRRGFDSVVQAPTGIAAGESRDGDEPGALPCQLLDHGTGYLAAAAVLDGLRRQATDGGTHIRRLSLARTAAWLTTTSAAKAPETEPDPDPAPWLQTLEPDGDAITAVRPPGESKREALRWPPLITRYGEDAPRW
jgi:crotonobetainyl-CoA:carnitine CoA-transferase CaiB-like acyl-CoA transferase